MFEEFADIKHGDGSPNCMSIKGLQQALHRMHVDKAGSDMAKEFKVVDLNGDGEIDLEEFLFAVKIRHGHGFEKGQYFITWNAYAVLDEAQKETLAAMFAKSLAHPLYGRVEEVKETAETAEQEPSLIMRSLSFKGKNLTTGCVTGVGAKTCSFDSHCRRLTFAKQCAWSRFACLTSALLQVMKLIELSRPLPSRAFGLKRLKMTRKTKSSSLRTTESWPRTADLKILLYDWCTCFRLAVLLHVAAGQTLSLSLSLSLSLWTSGISEADADIGEWLWIINGNCFVIKL